MAFQLPELAYPIDGLAPHISAETLEFHYGKHHASYVNNLNKLIEGKPEAGMSLEQIINSSEGGMFNNAAQIWNHSFYWKCLAPESGGLPTGKIAAEIAKNFGSFEVFKEKFTVASLTQFGSGWAWLVQKSDASLTIMQTGNAGCPLTENVKPLLTCDVWEHAYYIDYRNARPQYLQAFWNLINWDFVEQQLS